MQHPLKLLHMVDACMKLCPICCANPISIFCGSQIMARTKVEKKGGRWDLVFFLIARFLDFSSAFSSCFNGLSLSDPNVFNNVQTYVFGRPAVFSRPVIFATAFMSFFSVVIALFKVKFLITLSFSKWAGRGFMIDHLKSVAWGVSKLGGLRFFIVEPFVVHWAVDLLNELKREIHSCLIVGMSFEFQSWSSSCFYLLWLREKNGI